MSLNKSRLTVVVGLMMAIGGAVLWAADATDSSSAPPAQASADQTAEARKHLAVAHDLFSQHKYQQAEEENNTALELDPNLADAHLMKQLIEPNLSGDTASGSATPTDAQGRTFLTKAEINRVKLAEITPDDLATVRGSIPRKDLEDFWNDVVLKDPTQTKTTADDRAAFFNAANFGNQIQLIQTEQANKYLDKINIINDPIAVLDYKRTIQPFVLQNCATSRCHGGKENNGGFFYPHGGPDVNTAFYTAYYVINTLSFNGKKIIDRGTPESSLLIQYAVAHPGGKVPHRFASPSDPAAKILLGWIGGHGITAPSYGVDLPLPAHRAPASVPAGATTAPSDGQ